MVTTLLFRSGSPESQFHILHLFHTRFDDTSDHFKEILFQFQWISHLLSLSSPFPSGHYKPSLNIVHVIGIQFIIQFQHIFMNTRHFPFKPLFPILYELNSTLIYHSIHFLIFYHLFLNISLFLLTLLFPFLMVCLYVLIEILNNLFLFLS